MELLRSKQKKEKVPSSFDTFVQLFEMYFTLTYFTKSSSRNPVTMNSDSIW